MARLGAQMYTVRDYTKTAEDFLETLKKLKAIGYKEVQVSGIGKDLTVEDVASALKETGLHCGATHISFDDMKNDLDAVIKKHKAWDCPYVGVGGLPREYICEEGFKAFAKEANVIGEKLAAEGLTFIYHNHNHEFAKFGEKTGMEILYENANKYFQFELDVYWVTAGGGDPIAWINKMRGRMDVIHYKDMGMNWNDGERVQKMAPIGAGNLNWQGIIAASEYCKYIFVEQDTCEKCPFECLDDSFKFLSRCGVV